MKPSAVVTTCMILAGSLPALGDVSYEQKITVDAAGGMSMFASEGEIVSQISGKKSRTDSDVSMKSKLAGMFSGSGRSRDIVRLDEDRSLHLLPDDRQYYVMSFAEAREQLENARQAMSDAQSSGESLPVSAGNCMWTEGHVDVEHPKGTTEIAGIKTRQHTVRVRQFCDDPETGNTCDITWLMDTWLAKKVPGEKEVRKFHQAYARAMGLDDLEQQMQGPALGLLNMFSSNWESVLSEFEKMKGYPMRTIMQMSIGGDECTAASGQPIANDTVWADATTAGYNAALDQAGSEAGIAMGQAAGEAMGDSVAGNIGGAAVGAAAGELIGGFTGMFRKKKKSEEPVPEAANNTSKQVVAFRITTEITDWSTRSIPDEQFDEPTHWEKIDGPQ